jgi:hypothetical protein
MRLAAYLTLTKFKVYVDVGASGTDTATLAFTFPGTATSSSRKWLIKVTQVPCSSASKLVQFFIVKKFEGIKY